MNPVYILGLDAYDHVLMKRWAADGLLPNFARLLSTSPYWDLHSSTQVLQGSIWPSFATSDNPASTACISPTRSSPAPTLLQK